MKNNTNYKLNSDDIYILQTSLLELGKIENIAAVYFNVYLRSKIVTIECTCVPKEGKTLNEEFLTNYLNFIHYLKEKLSTNFTYSIIDYNHFKTLDENDEKSTICKFSNAILCFSKDEEINKAIKKYTK